MTQKRIPLIGETWVYHLIPYDPAQNLWEIRGRVDDQIVFRYWSEGLRAWVYECRGQDTWDWYMKRGNLVYLDTKEEA